MHDRWLLGVPCMCVCVCIYIYVMYVGMYVDQGRETCMIGGYSECPVCMCVCIYIYIYIYVCM